MTNGFIKKVLKKAIIFSIEKDIIDDDICLEIIKNIDLNKRAGLDMSYVKSIQSKKFIQFLANKKFFLFNLENELLCYLSIILKEGMLKTFMNKSDFLKNKRELIKRRFTIV